MEVEEDDEMRILLEAVEPRGEFGKDLDRADGPLEEARRGEGRGRQVRRILEARPDDADGPETEPPAYFPT